MAKFKVMRQHQGDKPYAEGDTRDAEERDVAHLIANGVLQPIRGKADPTVRNKADPAVQNKAQSDK